MVSVKEPKQLESHLDSDDYYMLMHGIRWKTYVDLLDDLQETQLRITYDRGRLEIMTVTSEHESWVFLLHSLLTILSLELRRPFRASGQTTFSKRTLDRGLQPDNCYWIKNESKVRRIRRYDINKHALPDLVVEVDITSNSMNRIEIYEALKIKEVWRWDGEKLQVRVLANGRYELRHNSTAWPGLQPADLVPFLQRAFEIDQVELLESFKNWVRDQVADGKLKVKKK